jgi:Skp family chaperone for outer membrane proteins
MIVKRSLALGALSTLALASTAFAQTPAAAPGTPAGGPPIPGVCVFYRDAAIANSMVGKAMAERMKTLVTYVQAELQPEGQALQAEEKALEGMTQEQLQANQQRVGQFQARLAAFQRKQQLRNQELQATQAEQVQNILQQADPIINSVYAERKCSLLIDRAQIYGANPEMDVTKTVVDRLNAKITTITFDRKHLDQGGGAQQAAATAPAPAATPTPTKKKK